MKKNPIYLRTYIGKPPDEPLILGGLKKMSFVMWHNIKLDITTSPLLSQALLHTSTNKWNKSTGLHFIGPANTSNI